MTSIDEVKTQAQDRAGKIAGRAKGLIIGQIGQRSSDIGATLLTYAESIRTVGDTLREQGADAPAKLADTAASRLDEFATYLSTTDGERLVAHAEALARRQPMMTMGAGLALGILAARLLKASATQRYREYGNDPLVQPFGRNTFGGSASYYED
ncbi:MAG: hypothetical protein M3126_01230 [Candidatus Eremiobacteraeota bacterium]|nr:hypothetical protein [Candidatus Eremiobacteraeota bacterium]